MGGKRNPGRLTEVEAAAIAAILLGEPLAVAMSRAHYSESAARNALYLLRERYETATNCALVLRLRGLGFIDDDLVVYRETKRAI